MATVTRKGQVTLPKRVRDALGLQPGAQVDFEIRGDTVILRRRVPVEVFERWRGVLREAVGGKGTDELLRELRGE
jgi:AbrB family looped-hinge helix DNA binding protein